MRSSIIITTIFLPKVLDIPAVNLKKHSKEKDIELTKVNNNDCYHELSIKLEETVREDKGFSLEVKRYLYKICNNIRIWLDICKELERS